MRKPNLLTPEDFKDKELNPNSTPLQVLAFVAEVALQKLKKSKSNLSVEENVESDLSKKNGRPLKNNNKRKSQPMKKKSERKVDETVCNEKWIEQIKSKKKRGDIDNSNAPPPLPEEFHARIIEKCGGSWPNELTHIYHKKLFQTDVSKQHGRISMPLSQMESIAFLRDEEVTLLRQGRAISVPVIHKPMDNPLTELTIAFRQWDLHKNKKDPEKINAQYVLNSGWYTIATQDKFEVNQTVDIWAFRDPKSNLCMAVARRE